MTSTFTPSDLPVVTLKTERKSSHPWIFQKMVEKPETKPKNGSVVDIIDRTGAWVGRGLYNGHSRIALRVLTTNPDEGINRKFFDKMLRQAISLRRDVLKIDKVSDSYRLVHSEGDGLSGLVIDKFGEMVVVEFFSSGMYRFRETILSLLGEILPGSRFYWFAEEHVQKQESMDIRPPALPEPFLIEEHGLKFKVGPGSKHKTGFFVDQRENRMLLAQMCKDLSVGPDGGKREVSVLDICCNSGGFAVYAKALGGASEVLALDLDETVLELAEENARINKAKVKFIQVDLFHWLREAIERGLKYDVVILDPSKQTRTKEELEKAMRKYTDMNRLAMQVVKPGGILLTCSCTGLASESEFLNSIRIAAWQSQRTAQILKITGAGPDHPWASHVAEGRYLKAVWARIL
ncbi:MAG: class I SAM-dependent rRNA methyltransferase [Proteobacteria bacterium]|nr:class I SAM-dependent rRNA methyltransferase [Pseudomonadota bacterium]